MGTAFAPFVEPLLPIILEHMAYDHNKSIRKFALKTFKSILVAVGEPQNVQLLQQSMPMYIEQLTKALDRHDDKTAKILIKSLANNLRALGRCNVQNTQFLDQAHITALGPIIRQTLELVASLKSAHMQVISSSKATFDIDEEDMDKIKEEMSKVGRVASQVMELTGQLVEKFKDQAFEVVDTNSKAYWVAQMQAMAGLNDEEVCDVLCFFCDFVDNTSFKNDVAAVTQLAQKFVEITNNEALMENDIVRHTVAYGIGAFAHALPKEAFQPFLA